MTKEDISRYLDLVDRRLFIIVHSGIDWKPEYGPELECIDQEIAKMRVMIEQEHKKRERNQPKQLA